VRPEVDERAIAQDASVAELVQRLADENISGLRPTESGRLIGVVSSTDVLQAAAEKEDTGIGQNAGHTFAVSLREVDIFNGSHEFPFASGVANWQARFRIIDLTTGERITLAFVARFVTTPNGDWVVDRIESPPSCNGA
jgi:hypothetical protein